MTLCGPQVLGPEEGANQAGGDAEVIVEDATPTTPAGQTGCAPRTPTMSLSHSIVRSCKTST